MAFGKENPALKIHWKSLMELSHMDKGVLAALVTWIAKTDKSIS